jgi:Asp/Glu/hydantoin racemase
MTGIAQARILLLNPNSSRECSAGIDDAIAGFRRPGGPAIEVATVADGPPGIYSWRDWHAAVAPLCREVAARHADVFIVACASDPGIEAVREATDRPVLGVFRCAVAAALMRAERFGVIALVDASIGRHALALRALGLEQRLAAEIAMNTTIDTLLDPAAAREALLATGRALVWRGAGAVILGCTGMAGHRAALEQALGVPVIEPCQAAVAQALGIAVAAMDGASETAAGGSPAAQSPRAAG